jgi:hypothetical protein
LEGADTSHSKNIIKTNCFSCLPLSTIFSLKGPKLVWSKSWFDVPDQLKERQRLKERLREAKEKRLGRRSKEIRFTDEEVITM